MRIINWEPQKGSRYHKTVAHAKAGAPNWAGETNICPPSISLADTSTGFIYFVTVLRQL